MGEAAGGDHDEIGLLGQDVGGLGEDPVAELHAGELRLGDPPVDDPDQVPPPGGRRGETQLSAGRVGRLEDHHVVAELAEDPGRLQPRRTGTDHHGPVAQPSGGG